MVWYHKLHKISLFIQGPSRLFKMIIRLSTVSLKTNSFFLKNMIQYPEIAKDSVKYCKKYSSLNLCLNFGILLLLRPFFRSFNNRGKCNFCHLSASWWVPTLFWREIDDCDCVYSCWLKLGHGLCCVLLKWWVCIHEMKGVCGHGLPALQHVRRDQGASWDLSWWDLNVCSFVGKWFLEWMFMITLKF